MINPAKKSLGEFLGPKGVVLVVEPSINYRTSLKQFFANLKVKQLKVVASVADARREMLTRRIALFVVEWSLEDTNGLQFCRMLRREAVYKTTPFLLMSTENLRKDVILASEVHIDGYLLKPFSYEDFCAQILQMLNAHTKPPPLINLLDDADAKLNRGELLEAEQVYLEALSVRDTSARAMCGLARLAFKRGDAVKAREMLEDAVRVNPDYIEAFRIMLEIGEATNERSSIIQAASILNSLSPENPRYTLVLAVSYLGLNQLEASETFFKRTLSLSPRLVEAYKGLGNVYLAKDEYDLAMKNFNKALDLDKDDISTLNSLGTTYVRMGHYKEGIDKYLVALRLDPHDPRVLFNLGHANEKRGDLVKARKFYAQSLLHKPGYDKATRGLERVERLRRDDGGGAIPQDEPDEILPVRIKPAS